MKNRILFYVFKPITKVPSTTNKFKDWWDSELSHNQAAKPIDEFEIKEKVSISGVNKEEILRMYNIWLDLRKARKWLIDRL